MNRGHLHKAKTIVVKVGTSNLTDENSKLAPKKVEKVVADVMALRRAGKNVLLVTSGAIGAGVGRMGLKQRPKEMPLLQAAAAVGQGILMQFYEKLFSKHDQPVAQVLITRDDFTSPQRKKNLMNTFTTVLRWGAIPIINENDTVAIEEIRFGDNDALSALVATGINADLLIMLSDVDGLYTGDPNRKGKVRLIKTVERITPEIERSAGAASRGSGGMVTKIQTAKVTSRFGIPLVVVNGNERNVLRRVLAGEEIGTIFLPRKLGGR